MRIHSLQGLRAICISFVVLAHVSGTQNCFHSLVVERYGNLGVRIFLVLSGYLITTQLAKERTATGSISLKRFYARRAYRIFPAAYVFMLAAIATHWKNLSGANIATALTYTVNYYPHSNHVLGHLWSLGVEEQYYLLWPLCLLLFFRNRLWIVTAVVTAGPPIRILFWLLWGRSGLEHPFPVFMDALAMGAAVALLEPRLMRFQSTLASRWFLFVPAVTILLPLIQFWDSRDLPDRGPQRCASGNRFVAATRDGKTLCPAKFASRDVAGRNQLQPVPVAATVPGSLVVRAVGGVSAEPHGGAGAGRGIVLPGGATMSQTA